MKKIDVLCPKCGSAVALMEYGYYVTKELSRFEHFYEGWCPRCVERVVQHAELSASQEYRANKKK
jgi:endogenous inhibitor of DNA gyrase (YacG/DUF329 family)